VAGLALARAWVKLIEQNDNTTQKQDQQPVLAGS
jgi:hypothetical protein